MSKSVAGKQKTVHEQRARDHEQSLGIGDTVVLHCNQRQALKGTVESPRVFQGLQGFSMALNHGTNETIGVFRIDTGARAGDWFANYHRRVLHVRGMQITPGEE